jgi:uncharacterized protein (TIGR02270 family)
VSYIISEIATRHVEDAAFLWSQREGAVWAPHYLLGDVARLDDRLEAHLDGLRVNGEPAWDEIMMAAESGDAGAVFAAAVLSIVTRVGERVPAAIAMGSSDLQSARGLVSALGWLSYDRVRWLVEELWTSERATLRWISIAAMAIHRSDPGRPLGFAIADGEPLLRARALRAVGELGRLDLLPVVERYLNADDPEVRFSATWSSTLLSGKLEAMSGLGTIAQSHSRHWERAAQTAMRRADLGAGHHWLHKLKQEPATRRLAVLAAGAIGDSAEVPWLIDQMKIPELARVAGESFTTITGVDIAYQHLDGERPEGFEPGPTEDPADEEVEMDADENLAWPDAQLIQRWWQSNRSSFQTGTRYLLGKPIALDWLKQVLRIGRQRHRAAAALELAMRQPGTPLFEVRAPGFRQRQMLGV